MISPFIDPVTYRKVVFVKGEKGNAIMAEKFNLDVLGKLSSDDIQLYAGNLMLNYL